MLWHARAMLIMPGVRWTVFTAAVITSSGCAYGEMQEVLRTSLASEHDCPEVKVVPRNRPHLRELRPDYNNQYRVTGCGLRRMYTCPAESGLVEYGTAARCTFVEGDPNSPELAPMEPNTEDEGVPDFTQ